jgi:hypothetical protein
MLSIRKAALSIGLSLVGQQASLAASVVTCEWDTPEYPHISTRNAELHGAIDIKTSTKGECMPSTNPALVTAEMTLEVQPA